MSAKVLTEYTGARPLFPPINTPQKYTEVDNNSNLPLQIQLFVNVYLAPIWLISSIYYMYVTFAKLEVNYESVLSLVFFIIAVPLELCRLYLGYSGNLRERIPDLGGFLILSAFIQLPIQLYLFFILRRKRSSPIQWTIQMFVVAILLLQITFGYITIRKITKIKAQQFHIQSLIYRSNDNQNPDSIAVR